MNKLISLAFAVSALFLCQNSFALDCHGTEPFFKAQVSSSLFTLENDGVKDSQPITKVSTAVGTQESFLQVFSNDAGPVAVVKSAECNNGMSDEIFPKEVIIFSKGNVFYGCCGKANN